MRLSPSRGPLAVARAPRAVPGGAARQGLPVIRRPRGLRTKFGGRLRALAQRASRRARMRVPLRLAQVHPALSPGPLLQRPRPVSRPPALPVPWCLSVYTSCGLTAVSTGATTPCLARVPCAHTSQRLNSGFLGVPAGRAGLCAGKDRGAARALHPASGSLLLALGASVNSRAATYRLPGPLGLGPRASALPVCGLSRKADMCAGPRNKDRRHPPPRVTGQGHQRRSGRAAAV